MVMKHALTVMCFVFQLKWPKSSKQMSSQVDTDVWWSSLECTAIEAAVFEEAKLEPVLGTQIAPWIPPICRGSAQFNSEFKKKSCTAVELVGCPKKLGGLIRTGQYNPLEVQKLSTEVLHDLCRSCDIPVQGLSKVVKLIPRNNVLLHLYTFIARAHKTNGETSQFPHTWQ